MGVYCLASILVLVTMGKGQPIIIAQCPMAHACDSSATDTADPLYTAELLGQIK